jgi:hypothetical protein
MKIWVIMFLTLGIVSNGGAAERFKNRFVPEKIDIVMPGGNFYKMTGRDIDNWNAFRRTNDLSRVQTIWLEVVETFRGKALRVQIFLEGENFPKDIRVMLSNDSPVSKAIPVIKCVIANK